MIARALLLLGGIITLNLLSSCGPSNTTEASASPPPEAQAGPKPDEASFDPDKGLYLPEATRQSMGITTAPVQKKTFQAERTMKFQVFREADEQPLPGLAYRSGYAYATTLLSGQNIDLKVGQPGKVSEHGGSPADVSATLFEINALPNSNQTEVLVEIADPQHRFELAEFCTVRWRTSAVDAAAAVPDSALVKTTEGTFVYVQKEDRFIRTAVKTGATGEGFTEVTEGVAAGDVVVTNPVQTLWLTELKLKSGSEP